MGRNLEPQVKRSRRLGEALTEKAVKYLARRNFPPGVHGNTKRKPQLTGYGLQLQEKQKAKAVYGILEKQFANYVEKAMSKRGNSGNLLLQFLEMRLDNVFYRAGFAKTRRMGRQAVSHAHVTVNGRKVDVPSFQVRANDVIGVREKSKKSSLYATLSESLQKIEAPSWLSINSKELTIKVLGAPKPEEIPANFDVTKIVEFYSR
ncbi:MAG: 30S ribosomal protein S4 [Candidatus Magasanikbacteria bacterium GW2011_GWA2_45_39]|uniref:Small ribosomal subunit protein uS4 n=2 Tax=Candidatus Magasanikiibacteriota TaxID=1752731 RepID=A0A0G1QZP6_9BACT|nr:MAG: 30S ribosomal protein S4 [Candidatus Magasanikbacteria bacterium GW2011_GWA2_45_39]KKU14110.1 MAG: 30S ribosomal protein S4 [Candidatus Magasanikbacteria bacterium GW2011_GWC2_45_8]HBW73890.1 30S ribosomal protein S4 [Candidatus Magasanikbacteria bacterium]